MIQIWFRETGAKRNDIIDIFLDELDKDQKQDTFTKEELELGFVSTAILFFFAGFDTTSTTLSIVVHALMHHQEVQEKLRAEIEEVLGDDEEVTADHLKEMKIIDVVIHESMRRYFQFGKICEDVIIHKSNYYFQFCLQVFREYALKTTKYQKQI